MTNTPASRPRFTVRKMTNGRTGAVSFYVYDTIKKGRVSVHAEIIRESVQISADRLNAIEAEYAANLADPEWIARRDAILAEQEREEQERSAHFERIIAAQAAARQKRNES